MSVTVYSNGLNIRRAVFSGGTAGDHAVGASYGLEVGDVIEQVIAVELSGGLLVSSANLTAEFTSPVEVADQVSNTGGTDTTGMVLWLFFADQNPNG